MIIPTTGGKQETVHLYSVGRGVDCHKILERNLVLVKIKDVHRFNLVIPLQRISHRIEVVFIDRYVL